MPVARPCSSDQEGLCLPHLVALGRRSQGRFAQLFKPGGARILKSPGVGRIQPGAGAQRPGVQGGVLWSKGGRRSSRMSSQTFTGRLSPCAPPIHADALSPSGPLLGSHTPRVAWDESRRSVPLQGSDVIEYFARYGHTARIKVFHCNKRYGRHEGSPYELLVVPRDQACSAAARASPLLRTSCAKLAE